MTRDPGRDESSGPPGAHPRGLIEGLKDFAVYTTDPGGRVTAWSPGAERLLGHAGGAMLGTDAAALATPEDAGLGEPRRGLEAASSGGRSEAERWLVRGDGSRVWSRCTVTRLSDEAGATLGFSVAVRDLTERRRVEDEFVTAAALAHRVSELTPVLIWRADAGGRHDYFNRPWLEFTGREAGDGFGWVEGVHPDDRPGCLQAYRSAFARREPFECTFRLLRRDGRYRWLSSRGSPSHDPGGAFVGYLGSCTDVTDRVEREEALRRGRASAEDALGRKAHLLAALSHDARTPLNAVVMAAEHMEVALGQGADPGVKTDLTTILHAARNLAGLFRDVPDPVKADAGADAPRVSRFPLAQAVAECLAGVEPQARGKGLDVRAELGDLAGAVLETDRGKFNRIVGNFLSNALRYTDRGHIRLRASADGDHVSVSVEDTGAGISPADQGRVFEGSARSGGRRRPGDEGSGLGLMICRRLAALLGGRVSLSSEPGRGSTFALVLPRSVVAADAPPADPPGAVTPGVILVVEDDPVSRRALARVLRGLGCRVLEAGNGLDALALVRRGRPRLVLMDVNMPGMGGLEAARALRADPATRDVPIVAMTGDVAPVDTQRAADARVDGYLEKPITRAALGQALAKFLGPPG